MTDHPFNNVPDSVFQKMGMNLHQRPDHPLCILKTAIYTYFDQQFPGVYRTFDSLYPVVSTTAVKTSNFALPFQHRLQGVNPIHLFSAWITPTSSIESGEAHRHGLGSGPDIPDSEEKSLSSMNSGIQSCLLYNRIHSILSIFTNIKQQEVLTSLLLS